MPETSNQTEDLKTLEKPPKKRIHIKVGTVIFIVIILILALAYWNGSTIVK